MLIRFFFMLREGGLKVSITEFLTLMEVLQRGLAGYSIDEFYYLARATLVDDPLSDIDMVSTPVCHFAATVLKPPTELFVAV